MMEPWFMDGSELLELDELEELWASVEVLEGSRTPLVTPLSPWP
jgi:hypothetical protein